MSCGENRRTSAISGLFHPQNARLKRVRFRGYHKGNWDKYMDLNPHAQRFTAETKIKEYPQRPFRYGRNAEKKAALFSYTQPIKQENNH